MRLQRLRSVHHDLLDADLLLLAKPAASQEFAKRIRIALGR